MMDPGDTPGRRSRVIVEQLRRSQIYRDYERAFQEATGLPLSLRPIETFDLPHQGSSCENPFCALMASASPSCAGCLQVQRRVEEAAGLRPRTLRCTAGLWESAVPIHVGDSLIGFLRTGQILLRRPTKREFAGIARRLIRWGATTHLPRVEEAYFRTRVLTTAQYGSVLRLLAIFGEHLASLSNQLIVQEELDESPPMTRAKVFIAEHQAEDLPLSAVARAVNMSAFYFCKMFKQATGLTFTDYLARIRVEKVKNLLLDRHKRISEVAYMAGFQSLSQFNRVFRRVAGEAPTAYRGRMQRTAAA
jgi:AraC-like DNA-binding protein/ligand-binding sensor protein